MNGVFRGLARHVLGPRLTKYVRQSLRKRFPHLRTYVSELAGRRCLEIGGPSEIFGDDGFFPIYNALQSVDNNLFSARTVWTGEVKGGRTFHFHPAKGSGLQFFCEASDLSPLAPANYDCVLASHCLEHVANPLRALEQWKGVLRPGGKLLLILPHKDGTFDWRRPVTTLAHLMEDYEKNIGEDDLTHLPEILALHDLQKDRAAGTAEQFRQRSLENHAHRALHHHVFNTAGALAMVNYAGFEIIRVDPFRPYHIIILARCPQDSPHNEEFLAETAEYRQLSPFPSDRTTPGEQ